jgi:thymidylate kinase
MSTLSVHDPILDVVRVRHHDRLELVRALCRGLLEANVTWAFQGTSDAPATWVEATDAKDLDLWVASRDAGAASEVLASLGAVRVAHADDPRRLQHSSWWLDVDGTGAVIDVTAGPLAVGPVVLCPEAGITTSLRVDQSIGLVPMLSGVSSAMDLVVRPLLRGRHPGPERLHAGRRAWRRASPSERELCSRQLVRVLGRSAGAGLDLLDGDEPSPRAVGRLRRALVVETLRPRSLGATWRQRWSILPCRRGVGPAGIRSNGVLVVFVGTDGSGKSTLASEATSRLEGAGFVVRGAYFGMARGNLPGVDALRRLLGVAPVDGEQPHGDAPEPASAEAPAHPHLRKVAAWYYAFEYAWRWATKVALPVRRGEVVICDRYVYDLRWSPAPGSRAAALAQHLVGRPDVIVLPDAPAASIHARKPERTVAEIVEHQAAFRSLLAEGPARTAALIADTSGADPDPAADVIGAVVAAAHRRTARSR